MIGDEGDRDDEDGPYALLADHIETAFELGIEVREEAHGFGIVHYEVTGGLNSHPEFIAALAETTAAQIHSPQGPLTPLPPWPDRPRYEQEERTVRCENCRCVAEAHIWEE